MTITREELLKWIGSQVEKKYLSLPEVAGPTIWPVYGIKDLLSASVIEPECPVSQPNHLQKTQLSTQRPALKGLVIPI